MKALVQRVTGAEVSVEGTCVGKIGRGLLVFLGIEKGDTDREIDYLAAKVAALRVFGDDAGKMNVSVKDAGGSILLISQFTLAADCRKGTRPSFDSAESPGRAEGLYELFLGRLAAQGIPVESGKFGAYMQVKLVNDGPVTFLVDSRKAQENP